MENEQSIPSRVIIELNDGQRFATAWGTRAHDADGLPLSGLFTGKLLARVVGSEAHLPSQKITRVVEEIMKAPYGEKEYQRVVLQHRAPNETPKGRKLLAGAAKFADRLEGMTLARVDEIIDFPASSWPGWNGATVYSDGSFQVVVGERWSDTDCVMSVSRDNDGGSGGSPRPATEDPRRASGHKADSRRPVPTSVSDFLDRLKEYGFEVDDSRRHYGIMHPDKPGVSAPFPRTPSDHRWADNQVAQIKQKFGIDIRKPLD